MRKIKRLFSGFLAVILAFSIISPPVQVQAEDAYYDSSKVTATASSEELAKETSPASNVTDGDEATHWHSIYSDTAVMPHWIELQLEEVQPVSGLYYLPRTTGKLNGTITEYSVSVSLNGVKYETVARGSWEESRDGKLAEFDPVQAKYVRLNIESSVGDFASAAEMKVRLYQGTEEVREPDATEDPVKKDTKTYIREMISYYETYEEDAQTDIMRVIAELKQVDEETGEVWEDIMNFWSTAKADGFVNVGTVPENLPDDESMAVIILGYALTADGEMKPELIGRLQTGLEFANAYENCYVAVTGGGTATNYPDIREGVLMGEWLLNQGLDEDRLIIEDDSADTVENVKNTYKILREQYPQVKSVVLVTSHYHIPRGSLFLYSTLRLEALKAGIQPLNVISNMGYDAGHEGYERIGLEAKGLCAVAGINYASLPEVTLSVPEYMEVSLTEPYQSGEAPKLQVTAHYDTGYERDISDLVTIQEFDPALGEAQTILVTYTENGTILKGRFSLDGGEKTITASYAVLEGLLEQIEDQTGLYTKETLESFENAKAHANALLEKENPTETELLEGIEMLRQALQAAELRENVALKKPVEASHNQTEAGKITDGKLETYWSGVEDGTYIPVEESSFIIDLRGTYLVDFITAVPYYLGNERYYHYDISVSEDHENWTKFAEQRDMEDTLETGANFETDQPVRARYIKVEGVKVFVEDRPDIFNFHMNEMRVYGEPLETEVVKKDAKATLLFCSDFQPEESTDPYTDSSDISQDLKNVLENLSQTVYNAGYTDIDSVLMAGDYTFYTGKSRYNADPNIAITEFKGIIENQWRNIDDMLLIQGNHDDNSYAYDEGANEYEEYIVYCINGVYNNSEMGGFPWEQGKNAGSKAEVQLAAEKLEAYLEKCIQEGENRPVFIMAHLPLHFSGRTSYLYGTGDNLYASYLFDVMNSAAEDLDIVYLYGHNHSNGWDSYMGGSRVFKQSGDTILIPDASKKVGKVTNRYTEEVLNFTYLNAGYIGYVANRSSADELTATVCSIYEDKLVFERYSETGEIAPGADGAYSLEYDDTRLLASEYLAKASESSVEIPIDRTKEPGVKLEDTTATVGQASNLHAVLKNVEAASWSWSVSDPDMAVIAWDGNDAVVFGKEAGTTEVTVTVTDSNGIEYSTSAALEFTEEDTKDAARDLENIALYGEVTVDSGTKGEVLTDGKIENNYWSSSQGIANAYCTVELPWETEIEEIKVVTYYNHADKWYTYEVLVSTDNENWTSVGSYELEKNAGSAGYAIILEEPVNARYVKVRGLTTNNTHFHLVEVEVYGALENIAKNKPTAVNYVRNSENKYSAANITDGTPTTEAYWDSGDFIGAVSEWQTLEQDQLPYAIIDLEDQYNIDTVNVMTYYNASRYYKYQVYTSLDGVDYTLLGEKNDTSAACFNKSFATEDKTQARFIKVVGTYCSATPSFHLLEVRATGSLLSEADYSAVEAAVEKIPSDLSVYTDSSVSQLKTALENVKLGLEVSKQAEVDAMAQAIEDAVKGLELIPTETETPQPTETEVPEPKEDVTTIFEDVYEDWYTDYVQYVYDNNLMTGIKGTNNFEPNSNITKAQVAQVLYNMENQPEVTDRKVFEELTDVYDVEWYANAVAWAYSTGVVTGDLNTKQFNPNADVTREQLALMMFRYAKFKEYDVTATSDFAGLINADKVADWSMDGVKWAVGAGLISGIEANGVKNLAPQGNATRAQVAAILQRFCEGYGLE